MKKAHLHLIKWGLSKGYEIAVHIEGEYEGRYDTYLQAKEAVEAGDMGTITFMREWHKLCDMNECTRFAYIFEYDQEPDEIICDMSHTIIAERWFKEYAQEDEGWSIGSYLDLDRNQAIRNGEVIGETDKEVLVEYEMPNGAIYLNQITKFGDTDIYKAVSRRKPAKKWEAVINSL